MEVWGNDHSTIRVDDQHLTRNVLAKSEHEKEHRRGDSDPCQPAQRNRPDQGFPRVAGDGAGKLLS